MCLHSQRRETTCRTQNSNQKPLLTESWHTVPYRGCSQSLFLWPPSINYFPRKKLCPSQLLSLIPLKLKSRFYWIPRWQCGCGSRNNPCAPLSISQHQEPSCASVVTDSFWTKGCSQKWCVSLLTQAFQSMCLIPQSSPPLHSDQEATFPRWCK